MVITVLTILGSAFVIRSASESNIARRYVDSTRAFWMAEAGLAQAYHDWVSNPAYSGGTGSLGGGAYTIVKSATDPEVSVTGVFASGQRVIQASFVRIPSAFENTLSSGGNLLLRGLAARVEVYDKTRISGQYYKEGLFASGWFADKQEGVSQNNTTIKIPDYNNNGTSDEFADFVLFGRECVQSYPEGEAVYVQTNGTVNIFPDADLVGKKVVFVEGSSPGTGNVNIWFDGTWEEGEDLTVISTGQITYVEPLQFQEDARLNTASWGDYTEASIFRSEHESVVYTHDDANFVDILDWGSTIGNVIANDAVKDHPSDPKKDGISFLELLTYEKIYYSDRAANGDLPPGFQYLSGATGTPKLIDWQETQ